MGVYYHVTTDEGLKDIMKMGLIPMIGARSEGLEKVPAIYLFNSVDDVDTALGQWLGSEFDDYHGELHTLKVCVLDTHAITQTCEWETVAYDNIPASCISYYRNEG